MKLFFLAAGLFISASAFGHGDHAPKIAKCEKECDEAQIREAIPTAITKLVKSGKIDSAWESAQIDKVEQKTFKKGPEWVASLTDDKATDLSKKTLYIFITKKGYLSGSNFTGK